MQCGAVCCSVVQCVVVCCSVLQCVAVCCSVLQCVAVCCSVLQCTCSRREVCGVQVCSPENDRFSLQCSVLQCGAVCCSVLQCVAVCCSVLQCVAVCCSVLQCTCSRREACGVQVCSPENDRLVYSLERMVVQRVAACCRMLERVAVSIGLFCHIRLVFYDMFHVL